MNAIKEVRPTNPAAEDIIDQLMVAQRAVDKAIGPLGDGEQYHRVLLKGPCGGPNDKPQHTIIDRARIFQNWQINRGQAKQRESQSQSSVKRKSDEITAAPTSDTLS